MTSFTIADLPGDGIGPEVMAESLRMRHAVEEMRLNVAGILLRAFTHADQGAGFTT